MGRGWSVAWVVCAVSGALAACSNIDGLSGGGDDDAGADANADASGGPAADAAAPVDAGSSGPNLLTNGDFELGCAGWEVGFGSIAEVAPGRSSGKGCKFCMAKNWEAFMGQQVVGRVGPNETYYGEVWYRPDPSAATLADAGFVKSELHVRTGTSDNPRTAGPPFTGNDWVRATALLTTKEEDPSLEFELRLQQTGNPAPVGGVICVVVDDASLRRIK